jgi:hypothetical protein
MADLKNEDFQGEISGVLKDLESVLQKSYVEEIVEVGGFKFTLRTLTEDEEIWSDSHMKMDTKNPMLISTSKRDARLAAAIKAVNGVPVESMFKFKENADKDYNTFKNETLADPIRHRNWVMAQMLWFLAANGFRNFIAELGDHYYRLAERQDEVLKKSPKS